MPVLYSIDTQATWIQRWRRQQQQPRRKSEYTWARVVCASFFLLLLFIFLSLSFLGPYSMIEYDIQNDRKKRIFCVDSLFLLLLLLFWLFIASMCKCSCSMYSLTYNGTKRCADCYFFSFFLFLNFVQLVFVCVHLSLCKYINIQSSNSIWNDLWFVVMNFVNKNFFDCFVRRMFFICSCCFEFYFALSTISIFDGRRPVNAIGWIHSCNGIEQ